MQKVMWSTWMVLTDFLVPYVMCSQWFTIFYILHYFIISEIINKKNYLHKCKEKEISFIFYLIQALLFILCLQMMVPWFVAA